MRARIILLAYAVGAAWALPAANIAVVTPADAFGISLGKHVQRWLKGEGVACDIVPEQNAAVGLSGKRLAYWVMPKDAAALARFRAAGGKSCVFYSVSPQVAAVMGVRLGAYKKPAAGTYAKMVIGAGAPAGSPSALEQSSANVFTAFPVAGRSRVIGMWHDRAGRSTGDAAVLASDAGWWTTHVFLADGDEEAKACFLAAIAGNCVPGAWNAQARLARKRAVEAADLAYARAQKPRGGEIRAVWDHSGQGLYPGDWPRTIALLRANGISDLYVNVAGAAFAHYASAVLPRSLVCAAQGDQLAQCLAASRGTGLRVHAWMLCFNATRGTPARLADFAKRGWRLKNREGKLTEYLDPSNAGVRAHVIAAVREIAARYPVAGVHLDFVRWYEGAERRSATPGAPPPGKNMRPFFDWRARTVSLFVSEASRVAKTVRRGCIVSAAVLGKYPTCVDSVGQDWENWIDAGFVDYVVPMNYTEDPARYAQFVAQQGRTRGHAMRVVSGIGVTANESRLSPRQVIDQVLVARRAGLAGVAFFDLDHTLANAILPYLRAGVFAK